LRFHVLARQKGFSVNRRQLVAAIASLACAAVWLACPCAAEEGEAAPRDTAPEAKPDSAPEANPDAKPQVPAKVDRAAAMKEISDFTPAGMNRRFGPDFKFYNPKGPAEPFPDVYLAPVKTGGGGRHYELGGPWTNGSGDYSSTQGQVLYATTKGPGVDRVTTLEWSNGCYSERPEPPWWGGFMPEPCVREWNGATRSSLGRPIAGTRGMGPWSNCGIYVFSNGWLVTAGPASRPRCGHTRSKSIRAGSRR